jgi:hypothetical protein
LCRARSNAVAGIAAANLTLPLTPHGGQAAQLYSGANNASNVSGSSAWPVDQGAAAQGMASALLGNARTVWSCFVLFCWEVASMLCLCVCAWPVDWGAAAQGMASALVGNARMVCSCFVSNFGQSQACWVDVFYAWPVAEGPAAQGVASALLGNARKVTPDDCRAS